MAILQELDTGESGFYSIFFKMAFIHSPPNQAIRSTYHGSIEAHPSVLKPKLDKSLLRFLLDLRSFCLFQHGGLLVVSSGRQQES